jgi:predicted DNA-binding protein YlxM (UPF0122 family)
MAFPAKTNENEKIIKMHDEEKMSFSEIGDEFGLSKQAVHERYDRHTEDE